MTTLETRDTEAPGPIETNGHAEGAGARKRKAAQREEAVVDIEHRAEGVLRELDEAITMAASKLGRLTAIRQRLAGAWQGPDVDFRVIDKRKAPADVKTKRVSKSAKSPKRTRTPRADSVPSKVLAALSEVHYKAAELAKKLKLKPARVHSALQQLGKSGKVTSKGKGRDRVWSVA